MGFWIFLLIMCLMIPGLMLLFGFRFRKSAPKEINPVFGYRTDLSMKNRETWRFAHEHCGRLWIRLGLVLLPVSIVPMLFVLRKSEDVIGTVGSAVTLLETAVMMLSLIPTQRALKQNFHSDGTPRK